MGKHHFQIRYNSKVYKSYLDDSGEVWVFDDAGQARTRWMAKPIVEINEARETALNIVKELKL